MVFEIIKVERCPWHGCRLIWFIALNGEKACICEEFLIKKMKMSKEMVDDLIREGSIEKLFMFLLLAMAMAKGA